MVEFGQDRCLIDIEVPVVVTHELVVPLDLAGVGVERQRAAGVQVETQALLTAPGSGVARGPEDAVQLGIVAAGDPGRTAAVFPDVTALGPGLAARLAGRRDGVGLPHALAGVGVAGFEVAAHAPFAAADAGDDAAFHDERRERLRVAEAVVIGVDFPDDFAGLRVVTEKRADDVVPVDSVLVHGHAAVGVGAVLRRVVGQLRVEVPKQLTGLRVNRVELALRAGDVHHAAMDDGRALLGAVGAE